MTPRWKRASAGGGNWSCADARVRRQTSPSSPPAAGVKKTPPPQWAFACNVPRDVPKPENQTIRVDQADNRTWVSSYPFGEACPAASPRRRKHLKRPSRRRMHGDDEVPPPSVTSGDRQGERDVHRDAGPHENHKPHRRADSLIEHESPRARRRRRHHDRGPDHAHETPPDVTEPDPDRAGSDPGVDGSHEGTRDRIRDCDADDAEREADEPTQSRSRRRPRRRRRAATGPISRLQHASVHALERLQQAHPREHANDGIAPPSAAEDDQHELRRDDHQAEHRGNRCHGDDAVRAQPHRRKPCRLGLRPGERWEHHLLNGAGDLAERHQHHVVRNRIYPESGGPDEATDEDVVHVSVEVEEESRPERRWRRSPRAAVLRSGRIGTPVSRARTQTGAATTSPRRRVAGR